MSDASFKAFVSWPSAPLTDKLVKNALESLDYPPTIVSSLSDDPTSRDLLQWSTYDLLDHDLTYSASTSPKVLSSSYVIRKALIRKHYLSRCTHNYLVKHPVSALCIAIPQTWYLELSFADELDEMWGDELWDLGKELDDESSTKWWILKPGMADRGMGIRLFHSKEELERIFLEFENDDSEDELEKDDQDGSLDTSVIISQLRHFVIQEYLSDPVLLDPSEVPLNHQTKTDKERRGHKFHLRAYCVASGALTVYLYQRILALFSAVPYSAPSTQTGNGSSESMDLAAHLTNTSLQTERGEAGVRLLDELIGCQIISGSVNEVVLSVTDVEDIRNQMSDVLAETFKAALDMSVHFQPLPNAFELYGIDFLVTHHPSPSPGRRFQVHLLEVNAEPAIELTGPRLTWILQDLFSSIARTCVAPFFQNDTQKEGQWAVGQERDYLRMCLQIQVRGASGW